jgi:hypothetical protein
MKLRNYIVERKKFEESLKLKQNNINSLNSLNLEKQKLLDKLKSSHELVESNLAVMKAEKANF